MTERRRLVVEAARGLVGIRFRPMGRTAAVGLDCVGLVFAAHAAAGVTLKETMVYRIGETEMSGPLLAAVVAQGRTVAPEDVAAGDVVVVLVNRHPRHLALVVGLSGASLRIVHASTGFPRKVAEGLLEREDVALAVNFLGEDT